MVTWVTRVTNPRLPLGSDEFVSAGKFSRKNTRERFTMLFAAVSDDFASVVCDLRAGFQS